MISRTGFVVLTAFIRVYINILHGDSGPKKNPVKLDQLSQNKWDLLAAAKIILFDSIVQGDPGCKIC